MEISFEALKTSNFQKDFKASLVVFLVALPLCMGISLASQAPLFSGILSGIIGGTIVGLLSTSHTSVSGPAAGLTVIVITAIQSFGDFYSFTLAVMIAGLIQIGLGFLKAGHVGGYFPNSVITGMLAAIGLTLILKQIPHFVGFDHSIIGDDAFIQRDKLNTFTAIILALKNINWAALIISVISLTVMVFWENQANKQRQFFKVLPGPIVAVITSILVSEFIFDKLGLFLSNDHFVNLQNQNGVVSFFAAIKLPRWEALNNPLVYKTAITLAIVASLESLLSVEAVDKIDPRKRITNKNKELLAQGTGNLLSGLIGGLPITSVVVRSTANISSGAKTKLSTIFHGVWLFLGAVFMPRYLEMIPLATFSAILILVGYKLCSPEVLKKITKQGKKQLIPFIITILAILFTDLLIGIVIGLAAGFIFVIISHSTHSIVVVRNNSDFLIRFSKDVSFLKKPVMKKILDGIPNGSAVIIDGSNPIEVDNDIIVIIEEFLDVCPERNIDCEIIKASTALNPFFKS